MRTTRHGGAAVALLAVLGLLAGLLAGCSSDDDGGESLLGPGGAVSRADAQQLLDRRADAIRDHDLARFLTTIDTDDKALVRRQRRYFANLQELPLAELSYDVLKADWPAGLRAPGWGAQVCEQPNAGIQIGHARPRCNGQNVTHQRTCQEPVALEK